MSAPSTSAPAPSRHVFLYELGQQPTGAKVRFLCCVLEYNVKQGGLLVEHAYPPNTTQSIRAYVDVSLVLETVPPDMLRTGAWLNVMGYIQKKASTEPKRKRTELDVPNRSINRVQAILMWSAGALRIQEYEKTLTAHREAQRKAKAMHQTREQFKQDAENWHKSDKAK